ncbi:Rpm1-interacting protein 4-like [Thalictrum thalictroides]|uniref:Rpm1-interacting protein 4-like n=1 Tax=Thalictrum thalictroides TaxID=46969 RepID=A0A7J6WWM1_THATH|nr:Rpm1-interacting protein 4-like [Thalictrum thalictroides]
MAQRSHVPKFGDWESENVPYTAYFENARNEKADKGAKMINPNDPEENPGAFTYGSHHVVRAPSFQVNTDIITPVARRKDERRDREEGSGHHSSGSQKSGLGQQKSRSRTSTNTESGSDVSSSDRSLLASSHHRTRSAQKKNLGGGGSSFPPPSPPSQVRGGSHQSVEIQPPKAASVPKFGAWDETDPRSGEGFTVIFNKMKEEKQIGSSRLPTARPEINIYSSGQRHENSPTKVSTLCAFAS